MNYFAREANLQRLQQEQFDLLIIGGGITGAGIARDAAMRGLRVALIEARDFASGTSSKSSKMLHGGIRYLEQFHLALVFEASKERRLHSEFLSPHMAKPVPYLIPVYPWSPHSKAAIAAGVYLYDTLALFRNHGTRVLNREVTLQEEPRLESQGLKGSVVYHDAVMDDARIAFENVRSAVFHGAAAVNYMTVRGFEKDGTGRIKGVWIRDMLQKGDHATLVKAKLVVNASGPWCDYIRRLDQPHVEDRLRPTKGVHIILPKEKLGKKHAFVLTAKKDDRVFFSVPWYDRTLVGTTDTDYDPARDGSLHDIRANQNDVDYLLEGVKRTFPHADVSPDDIQSTFAGLRPLVSEGKGSDPSAVSREHLIWQEDSGLLNIAGGKYTTYRVMAQQLVDQAVKILQKEFTSFGRDSLQRCATEYEPLVLAEKVEGKVAGKEQLPLLNEYVSTLGGDTVAHLQARYGARWQLVADMAMDRQELRERIVSSEPDVLAEVVFSKEYEMAVSFEDFLRRRTMLALKAPLVQNFERVQTAAKLFGTTDFTLEQLKQWQGLSYGKK